MSEQSDKESRDARRWQAALAALPSICRDQMWRGPSAPLNKEYRATMAEAARTALDVADALLSEAEKREGKA